MPQHNAWEKEYQNPSLLTKKDEPQKDVLRFLKFLRKDGELVLENLNILDLGSGTGRNANYLAEMGNNVSGIEISKTAVSLAIDRAKEKNVKADYYCRSMGESFPFPDDHFDLLLDVTSSNSLNESEREIFLSEAARVLKPGGWFFVKALCKDGDKNAKELIKNHPGKEKDTYIFPGLDLRERAFSLVDFTEMYGRYFKIEKIFKKTSYTVFNKQKFRRNFLIGYLRK